MGAQLLPSGKLLGRCRAAGSHEHQEPATRRVVTKQRPHEPLPSLPKRLAPGQLHGRRLRARSATRSDRLQEDRVLVFSFCRRAAQYSRMRADIACRFARSGADTLGVAGVDIFIGPDEAFDRAAAGRFAATGPPAARAGGVAGAISIPNIAERSSLASALALVKRLGFFD